jgi:hypothetical protein
MEIGAPAHLLAEEPQVDAPTAKPERAPLVVENDGAILVWDGVSTELRPLPAGLTSGVNGPRKVVAMPGGRALLLEPAPPPGGRGKEKGHRTHEGEAVVLEVQDGAPRRSTMVAFEGLPIAGVVDGYRAWVVTWRGDTGLTSGKGWLHAIDLEEARVTESSLLSARPLDLVLDAKSARLYIAYPERLQTYGITPLRVSWQYRSPGRNGPLTLLAGGVVAAVRQSEVALFEAARIDARNADERRHLQDDATAVVPLPFAAERLSASKDGTLALATGPAGLAFIDAAGAARTPETPPHNLEAAVAAVPLDFPGSGRDLIVALFPGGAISAVRSPEAPRILKVETISPDVRFETETAVRVPDGGSKDKTAAVRVPENKSPTPAPASAAAPESPAAAPDAVPVPGPTASAPQPAAEPERPGTPQPPGTTEPVPGADASLAEDHPLLSGHISGAHQKAHQVALYGPNNILKEYRRAPVDAQGSWSLPLPPPGTYRVIPIGDGSNPLPVVPGFRTITVKDGTGQQGLDFEMR